jgi:hypothetical protein
VFPRRSDAPTTPRMFVPLDSSEIAAAGVSQSQAASESEPAAETPPTANDNPHRSDQRAQPTPNPPRIKPRSNCSVSNIRDARRIQYARPSRLPRSVRKRIIATGGTAPAAAPARARPCGHPLPVSDGKRTSQRQPAFKGHPGALAQQPRELLIQYQRRSSRRHGLKPRRTEPKPTARSHCPNGRLIPSPNSRIGLPR